MVGTQNGARTAVPLCKPVLWLCDLNVNCDDDDDDDDSDTNDVDDDNDT